MAADRLVQIVDAALVEATRNAGVWLVCRPGCTPCCYGPFPITDRDAERLREGLAGLDADRAARVRQRAQASVTRLQSAYPADTLARVLEEDDAAADEPCPALDPETGLCDLYEARPITCRTFGPPLHFRGEALGVCELCFDGATEEQIAACAVTIDAEEETEGQTIVAYAVATLSTLERMPGPESAA